jgi:hypothetical protein
MTATDLGAMIDNYYDGSESLDEYHRRHGTESACILTVLDDNHAARADCDRCICRTAVTGNATMGATMKDVPSVRPCPPLSTRDGDKFLMPGEIETHNAGVEGSSPSPAIDEPITYGWLARIISRLGLIRRGAQESVT